MDTTTPASPFSPSSPSPPRPCHPATQSLPLDRTGLLGPAKVPVLVGKALGQVEIRVLVVAVVVPEPGAKHADRSVALNGDAGILGRRREARAVPAEVAIPVANVVVKVDLDLPPLAVDALEVALEDVFVLKVELLGSGEEVAGHGVWMLDERRRGRRRVGDECG